MSNLVMESAPIRDTAPAPAAPDCTSNIFKDAYTFCARQLGIQDNGAGKPVAEADRKTVQSMIEDVTYGDGKALGKTLQAVGGDQEKLKALIENTNNALSGKGSSSRLDLTADGKVLMHDLCNSSAIAVDPVSGEAKVTEVRSAGSTDKAIQVGVSGAGADIVSGANSGDKEAAKPAVEKSEKKCESSWPVVTPYMSPVVGFPFKFH